MNKRLTLLLLFVLLLPAYLKAFDFGLLLSQRVDLSGNGGGTGVDMETVFVPRFSALIGEQGDLYLSASIKAAYENEEWNVVPELLRNEIFWRMGNTDLRLGRMVYADPMNLVAAGLFDGAMFSRHTARGTFGAGVWYTGLLYKNRANISMTEADTVSIQEEALDWENFAGTYFASRRLMAAFYWDNPSVAELFRFTAAVIGQADLNNRDSAYHNQYLIARAALPFQRFIFELGGALEVAQFVYGGSVNLYMSFAADIGLHWIPPAQFYNMLSLTGRFTSPAADGSLSAFTPITSLSHGNILRVEIPGLSILSLNYSARLHRTFSVDMTASHFMRSDRETFTAYPLDGQSSNNHFLGTEFFGRFIWSPFSDLHLNMGAGAFLPSLGDVAPNADPRWRVELTVTLAAL